MPIEIADGSSSVGIIQGHWYMVGVIVVDILLLVMLSVLTLRGINSPHCQVEIVDSQRLYYSLAVGIINTRDLFIKVSSFFAFSDTTQYLQVSTILHRFHESGKIIFRVPFSCPRLHLPSLRFPYPYHNQVHSYIRFPRALLSTPAPLHGLLC